MYELGTGRDDAHKLLCEEVRTAPHQTKARAEPVKPSKGLGEARRANEYYQKKNAKK